MDNITPEQRKKNMKNIRSKNSEAERKVMRELRRRNIYFAKHDNRIIGKPDIVFRRKRVIVFVDSDFWHGHPDRGVLPKSNVEYWHQKIERNKQRDLFVTAELNKKGWKVIRLWELDILNKTRFVECINEILISIDRVLSN